MNSVNLSHCKMRLRGSAVLFIIIFVGAILRLIVINKAINFDEALSIYIARQPLGELFSLALRGCDAQLPLFNLLLYPLLKISSSEIWIRTFLMGCGLLVIYMTYKLGKLIFDEFVGLLSCLLVAFSESYIYYSVEIRIYIIWILLCLTSIYFFMKSAELPSYKNIFFYIISTTFCIYAHYLGIFVLLVEFIFFVLNKNPLKMKVKLWLKILSCILILLTPQIIYGFFQFQTFPRWGQYFHRSRPTIKNLFRLFIDYSGHISICIFFFLIAGYAVISKMQDISSKGGFSKKLRWLVNYLLCDYKITLAFLYFLVPILATFFIYPRGFSFFFEHRYLLPFFIVYYFIIARSVSYYKNSFKKLVVIFLILITFSNALRFSIVVWSKPRFELKKAAELLKIRLQQDDIVAVSNIFKFLHIFNYLNRPFRIVTTPEELGKEYLLKIFAFKNDEAIVNFDLLRDKERLWLIMEKDADYSVKWLTESKHVELKEYIDIGGIDIRLYNIHN